MNAFPNPLFSNLINYEISLSEEYYWNNLYIGSLNSPKEQTTLT